MKHEPGPKFLNDSATSLQTSLIFGSALKSSVLNWFHVHLNHT